MANTINFVRVALDGWGFGDSPGSFVSVCLDGWLPLVEDTFPAVLTPNHFLVWCLATGSGPTDILGATEVPTDCLFPASTDVLDIDDTTALTEAIDVAATELADIVPDEAGISRLRAEAVTDDHDAVDTSSDVTGVNTASTWVLSASARSVHDLTVRASV